MGGDLAQVLRRPVKMAALGGHSALLKTISGFRGKADIERQQVTGPELAALFGHCHSSFLAE